MSAHNKFFPWMTYYGNYKYFEGLMQQHNKVTSIIEAELSVYKIERLDGKLLRVFICECYSFDIAEYIEVCEELGDLDAIIINSIWCGYSNGVKYHCMKKNVGVYDIRGFMAALNKDKYWLHLTHDEKKIFIENGWL